MRDQMELKELTIEQIAHDTDIPEVYIDAIHDGRSEKLPPLPYIKSHLRKLAVYLELDPSLVSEAYRSEFSQTFSGADDTLPHNRFALPSHKIRWIIGAAAALFLLLGVTLSARLGSAPILELTVPDPNENPYVVSTPTVAISGRVKPGDKLFINDQAVTSDETGRFEQSYRLEPELNTIEFRVKRFLGNETRVVKQIYLQLNTDVNSNTTSTNGISN